MGFPKRLLGIIDFCSVFASQGAGLLLEVSILILLVWEGVSRSPFVLKLAVGFRLILRCFILSHKPWIIASCTCLSASPSYFGVTNYRAEGRSTELSHALELGSHHAPLMDPQPSRVYPFLLASMLLIEYEPFSRDLSTEGANLFRKKLD